MGILQEVTCAHCREIVSDPITLDCFHHLCAEHVANFSNRQAVECPICKAPTPVSEGGLKVDSVKKIVVNYLQGSEKNEEGSADRKDSDFVPPVVTCANCEEEVATLRCIDCRADGAPLCEACSKRIHAQGLFTNHTFVDVDAQVSQKEDKDQVRMACPEHGEKLDFYCISCRCLVCSYCLIVGGHINHDKTGLEDAYNTSKDTIRLWRSKMSVRLNTSKDLLEEFSLLEEEVTKNAERQRENVNMEMDRLRELVEIKRRQLLGRSAVEERQKRTELQLQMQRVQQLGEEAQSLVNRCEVLEAFDSKHAFIVLVLQLIQDMNNCNRREVDDGRRVNPTFLELYTDHQVKTMGELDLGRAYVPQTFGGIHPVEASSSSTTVHHHAFGGSAAIPWGPALPHAAQHSHAAQHVVLHPPHAPHAPHAPHPQVIQVYRASLPPQG